MDSKQPRLQLFPTCMSLQNPQLIHNLSPNTKSADTEANSLRTNYLWWLLRCQWYLIALPMYRIIFRGYMRKLFSPWHPGPRCPVQVLGACQSRSRRKQQLAEWLQWPGTQKGTRPAPTIAPAPCTQPIDQLLPVFIHRNTCWRSCLCLVAKLHCILIQCWAQSKRVPHIRMYPSAHSQGNVLVTKSSVDATRTTSAFVSSMRRTLWLHLDQLVCIYRESQQFEIQYQFETQVFCLDRLNFILAEKVSKRWREDWSID